MTETPHNKTVLRIKRLKPQLIDEEITKIRKDSNFIVLTPRIFRIYQKYKKIRCVSCSIEFRVFDTVYNSSTRKPYHILCALAKKLITC